ncbi:CopG domain protein DNA-binding domain protein [Scytonema sp. HK-05]|nr:CopG domain protein DNA-binding domain protein [Scytonema sp. HK-05]
MLRVRLSEKEFEILKEYAESTDMQISEVIRDFIKDLARLKKPS